MLGCDDEFCPVESSSGLLNAFELVKKVVEWLSLIVKFVLDSLDAIGRSSWPIEVFVRIGT